MPRAYDWHELEGEGDWVKHPGTRVNQVARLAKLYVARHLPEGSQVVTVTTPEGTVTFLAYVPPKTEAPAPPPVEPVVRPATKVEQRREARERKDAETRERQRNSWVATKASIDREVEGYDPYVPNKPSRDDFIYAKLSSARADGFTKEELDELEAYLESTTPKDPEPVADASQDDDEDEDETDD